MWDDVSQHCPSPRTRRLWLAKFWVILAKTTTPQEYKRAREKSKTFWCRKNCFQPKAELSSLGHGPCSHTRYYRQFLQHEVPWHLLALENQAGRRQFQLEQGVWGSSSHFGMLGFTERVLRTRQCSPLIFHTHHWEGETGFRPLPALPLLKNLSWVRMSHCVAAQSLVQKEKQKPEQTTLLYVKMKHSSLFSCSEETE